MRLIRWCCWVWLPVCFAQLEPNGTVWTAPDASHGLDASNGSFPNQQYCNLLGNALVFYDAQRAGHLNALEKERVPWRNDSVPNDGRDQGVDLSGGYFDAGNSIKSAFSLSFTLFTLSWTALDFGRAFDLCDQSAYLDNALRAGLDWLINAHPDPETLMVLVDEAAPQGSYWGGDQSIPTPRPTYQINSTHPGTDAAAMAAAAFAAASMLYSTNATSAVNASWSSTTLANATYSTLLLTHAQQLYDFAQNAKQVVYSDSVPQATGYESNGYTDDLVLAGLWLHKATANATYLTDAAALYNSSDLVGSNAVYNWDSKTPALPILLAQATLGDDQKTHKAETKRYFDAILSAESKRNSRNEPYYTKGGLLYYSSDSKSASLNAALNAANLASHDPQSNAAQLIDTQLNYLLGQNPMNCPYVVGIHPASPQNPHSSLASGGNNIATIDSVPEKEAYVLYGAVVGGPSDSDEFYDVRSDYAQTEAALDYNAPLVGLSAYKVLTSTEDPFYVSLDPSTRKHPSRNHGGGLSTGAIAAIAVVVSVVVLAALSYLTWRYRRHIK